MMPLRLRQVCHHPPRRVQGVAEFDLLRQVVPLLTLGGRPCWQRGEHRLRELVLGCQLQSFHLVGSPLLALNSAMTLYCPPAANRGGMAAARKAHGINPSGANKAR